MGGVWHVHWHVKAGSPCASSHHQLCLWGKSRALGKPPGEGAGKRETSLPSQPHPGCLTTKAPHLTRLDSYCLSVTFQTFQRLNIYSASSSDPFSEKSSSPCSSHTLHLCPLPVTSFPHRCQSLASQLPCFGPPSPLSKQVQRIQ